MGWCRGNDSYIIPYHYDSSLYLITMTHHYDLVYAILVTGRT